MVLAERLVLSLSSVIAWFRSVYCSRLNVRVLLVKLRRSGLELRLSVLFTSWISRL